ncbi:MAG: AraC family transcriptional regulator [Pirellulaceae bacterium]
MAALHYLASGQIQFHHELTFPPRRITQHRLLYLESGQGEFRISAADFHVGAGWLGLLAPGMRTSRYFDFEPVSYVFVEFSSPKPLIDDSFLECRRTEPQRSALIGLLESIEHQRGDHGGVLLSAAVQLMLPEKSQQAPAIDPRLQAVVDRVQRQPAGNPSVSQLAELAGVSEPHLRRLFRQHLHTTPKQFLLRERMEFAQRLLRLEGLRVGAVAELLQFESVYQFSAQYRHVLGRPPSADRLP